MAELDAYFESMIEKGGSDLHLSATRSPMVRTDGDVIPLDSPALQSEDINRMVQEIMPERNRQEFAELNDTDFAYEIPGFIRLRCNVRADLRGVGAVFRVIPAEVITAEQLNLPRGITDLCHLSKGLVVVTGPTGSGKSTTLAALVDLVNKTRSDHIITIEDPVEFVHKDQKCLVTQREVHTHTSSFSHALRAALRQDPDIVLVGEMRDLETIEIAIETAETGHLVFGTLHTSTAVGTVSRIIDTFPSERQSQIRSMLSSSLKAAICQTLCKKKGGGRVAAMEIMLSDMAIASLIREGRTHQIAGQMEMSGTRGMATMNDSLAKLVKADLVEAEEAYLKAVDKDGLVSRFNKEGIPIPDIAKPPEKEGKEDGNRRKKKA